MMDKTDLLFQMMEQPARYTDEQWQEILADEECRELYTMMSLTKSAVDAQSIDQQTDDRTVQQEWDRFEEKYPAETSSRPVWRKISTAAIITLLFCGIAYAAVRIHVFGMLPQKNNTAIETIHEPQSAIRQDENINIGPNVTLQDSDTPRLYDNVPLEQIMDDVATIYHVTVEWQSDEARALRLYYKLKPTFTLDDVVEMLNHFESIKITRLGDKLIISDAV